MKPAPPQEREKELPARRSRERAYHKQGGEPPVPRLVRELAHTGKLGKKERKSHTRS